MSVVVALMCAQGALGAPPGTIPSPEGIIASEITTGPDGNLWFTDAGETGPGAVGVGNGRIGRITPSGTITEFSLPSTSNSPVAITAGPDGNLWFTASGVGTIGRITPSGRVTQFPLPTGSGTPEAITAGPDGNLWFTGTEFAVGSNGVSLSGRIGRITPSGTITEFSLPSTSNSPVAITAGPDGNLWFTESGVGMIGRITPTGTITEFPLPTANSNPFGITAGPDGNLWFTEADAGMIGRITPSGTISEFLIPAAGRTGPWVITAGSDGNLWFTEFDADKIGRITPSGSISEFPIPTAHSTPFGITAGPDGNLWFTVTEGVFGHSGISVGAKTIGRITPSGTITEFPLRSGSTCVVPRLKGKTLTQARKLIARAHCKLGKVSRPRRHSRHKLVVVSQRPGPKKTLPSGAVVSLRLG
jgi:streptogramin lyase